MRRAECITWSRSATIAKVKLTIMKRGEEFINERCKYHLIEG